MNANKNKLADCCYEGLEEDTQGTEYSSELILRLKLVAIECGLTKEQAELVYPNKGDNK